MKNVIMVIIFGIFVCSCGVNPLEQEYYQQQAGIPTEHRGIAKYKFPNLSGFEPAKNYGIDWNCNDSSWLIDGHNVQVVTASGDNLLFVCDQLNNDEPLVHFCPNGIIISPPGEHDKCR